MKLLYIANIRLPTEKAHGIQIMKMCEAFADLGSEVTLVVPKRLNAIKDDPFEYYSVKRNFKIEYVPTVDLIRFGRFGFWIQQFFFGLAVALKVLRSRESVVYTRDASAAVISDFFGLSALWEVHTDQRNFLTAAAARWSAAIVVISRGLYDRMISMGIDENKIKLLHDGVDLDFFDSVSDDKAELRKELGLPMDRFLVGYVGKYKTMGETKGVEGIIDAVAMCQARKAAIDFVIVGANQDEISEINGLFSSGLAAGSGHCLGHVPVSRIPEHLKAMDVLIMNYPNSPHYAHIMSPLKLFEYMASRRPIVSSDLPSIREILSDADCLFVPPDNVAALSQAIMSSMGNGPESQRRAVNSYDKVRLFTWRSRAQKIIEAIHSLSCFTA